MTARQCPLCTAMLAPGRELCDACTGNTLGRLYDAPGLLRELNVTITRQNSKGDGGNGGDRIDYDHNASEAADKLNRILTHYAAQWGRTTRIRGDQAPEVARLMTTPRGRAALLATTTLGARTWAPDLAHELRQATDEAWRRIDRPPTTTFSGWCECGRALYARDDNGTATCPGCGTTVIVSEQRLQLLARLPGIRERIMTKPQLALLCRIPVGTLHRWSNETRIHSLGVNKGGQPLYLAGPIIDAALSGIPPERHRKDEAS